MRVRVPASHTSATSVPNPVRVRVPEAQTAVATSETRVPKLVKVRPLYPHIKPGKPEASDDEALPTARFVFVFTAEIIDDVAFATSL